MGFFFVAVKVVKVKVVKVVWKNTKIVHYNNIIKNYIL